ncbi:hypothetical protein BESB_033830 [Besnoitia besnoiti]|uniref:SRS domain-containing protein n=1 Tax=Besnoitia besnoiti TaxID=94643 RepID=A0A2A9MG02_BESBE|nr:hypothetical protein BESB_033830 [Besnoitia besnoiti]PFH36925.1 hypothetical protein BESB_033830 [Besnoitia besnoiti]
MHRGMGYARGFVTATHFAVAVLVALALVRSRPSYGQEDGLAPSGGALQEGTCDEKNTSTGGLALTLRPSDEYVSFKCGETGTAELLPAFEQQMVYDDPDCGEQHKKELQLACLDAKLYEEPPNQEQGRPKSYKLSVPRGGRSKTTLCYKCKLTAKPNQVNVEKNNRREGVAVRASGDRGDAGVAEESGPVGGLRTGDGLETHNEENSVSGAVTYCLVKIEVQESSKPGKPEKPQAPDEHLTPSTSHDGSLQVTECNKDTVTEVLSPEKTVRFRCEKDHVLKPSTSAMVYDDSDEQCTKEVELSSIVNAALKPPNSKSGTSETTDYYELALEATPKHDAALCYRCVVPDPDGKWSSTSMRTAAPEQKGCLLKVSVKGTDGSASLATSVSALPPTLVGSAISLLLYAMM